MMQPQILLVENHPELRPTISAYLQRHQPATRVTAMDSSEAALALVRTTPVDLIITANALLPFSGIVLIRRIREGNQRLPMIMYAAELEIEAQALAAGATYFFLTGTGLFTNLRQAVTVLRSQR